MNAKPSIGLFCICDPQGVLVQTTVSTNEQSAIDEWMSIEKSMNDLSNMFRVVRSERKHCFKSWEGFESEGYTVVKCDLIPHAN